MQYSHENFREDFHEDFLEDFCEDFKSQLNRALVAGQVLRVELPADVEKVVDAQGDGEDERHLGHPRRGEESLDPSPAVFRNLPRNFL